MGRSPAPSTSRRAPCQETTCRCPQRRLRLLRPRDALRLLPGASVATSVAYQHVCRLAGQ
eukprot:4358643-Prymnesium_polylepis.1